MGTLASVAVPRGRRALAGSRPPHVSLAPPARRPRPLPLVPSASGRCSAPEGGRISGFFLLVLLTLTLASLSID